MEQHKGQFLTRNLQERIASAIVLAPAILWVIYHGGLPYMFLIVMAAVLMSFEWRTITLSAGEGRSGVLWQLFGLGYVALPCVSLLWLRESEKGREIIFWLLSIVWATDIGAYFAGRLIGGWKLAPKISPNKTWSGLIGGMICAMVVGMVTASLNHVAHPLVLIFISGGLAVWAQLGDLLESWIKRHFGVKDSGHLIPGHGGILDRVDGIVTVAPKVAFLVLVEGGSFF